MKQKKSLKINMLLNAIKNLMSIIFPLISFPYVSKILGVDSVGRYNFATSVISYFILLAGLGINAYAIREGARYRDNPEKMRNFVNQVFSINIISTIISYFLFFILILIVEKFDGYILLLIILSLQIIFKTIGIDWIYSIYEDYAYITLRSIITQIISLISLFCFVKDSNDINIYAIITVIANVGSNIFNYFHSKKYCNVHFTTKMELAKHIKPIMILFATTLTISIFVNSDITVLGFMDSDKTVGIYAVSTKIYTIVKTLISSIIVVSIPRFSSLLGKNDLDEFKRVAKEVYSLSWTLVLPCVIGIILLRKEIVLVVSTYEYIEACASLVLLSLALISSFGAYFWSQCILISYKKDNKVLIMTVVSAIVNVLLNVILIPFFHELAAAITTIISETIVFLWAKYEGEKMIKIENIDLIILKNLFGCFGIIVVVYLCKMLISDFVIYITLSIVVSIVMYIIIELILKNEAAISIYIKIKNKICQKN